jgi:hypothetical protein
MSGRPREAASSVYPGGPGRSRTWRAAGRANVLLSDPIGRTQIVGCHFSVLKGIAVRCAPS